MNKKPTTWHKAWDDFAIWRRITWDLSGRSPEKVSGNSYLRMIGFISPFWPLVVLVLALSFTSIALGVIPAFITKEIINKTLPPHANVPLLIHLVELLAAIFLVKTLMGAMSSYLHGVLSNGIVQDLRTDLFSRLLKHPPEPEGRERSTTRVINDVGIASTGFSILGWRPEAMSGVVGFLNMMLGFINNGWSLFVSLTA
ncbi:MAG: hypothetical protein M1318_09165, partial [Firmicutes bacterium]|nr:hypothetical protein [Bacillota bacterium]